MLQILQANVDTENLESQQVDYNYTDSMSVYKSDGSFWSIGRGYSNKSCKRY